jgi:hypothetical protein
MGSRNPNTVPMSQRRASCETVGEMIAQGWEVVSCCQKCRLRMDARLKIIARLNGPQLSLWNRREPCRRLGCDGFVQFEARPPGVTIYRPLEAPWPQGKPPMRQIIG